MAIWVIDPEAILKFRRDHRAAVQRQRAKKRRENAEKPRNHRMDSIDRAWMAAVERDKD